jgi:hypothetical protein
MENGTLANELLNALKKKGMKVPETKPESHTSTVKNVQVSDDFNW